MKIITLWQPWASLIAYGLKRYETRSWPTTYRGPLLIHAAKRPFVSADGAKTVCASGWAAYQDAMTYCHPDDWKEMPFAHQLPLGTVVAVADLAGCYEMRTTHGHRTEFLDSLRIDNRFIEDQSDLERSVGNWQKGRYAWALSNVQRLVEPIPWRGSQGLRDAPPELQSLVATAAQKEVSK